jgi:hypothetical protein
MKKLKVKVNVREFDANTDFIDFLNIKDEINSFSINSFQDVDDIPKDYSKSKINSFYFIIKLAIKYLTPKQKKIFLNIWLYNCGEKKIKKDKKYYLNWILYKMALKNLKRIIIETPYYKYLERYLNENRK